jgi:quercetin dioxygenase-like cupin family protein
MPPAPEEIRLGPLTIRFVLEGADTSSALAMFEFVVPPGARVPVAHSHDAYEETLYGIEGVLTLTVDGKKTELHPGNVLFIPRGAVHRFDNVHAAPAKTLAVLTPGILSPTYFRELAALVQSSAGPPSVPPDPAAIATIMRRHGLTPVP